MSRDRAVFVGIDVAFAGASGWALCDCEGQVMAAGTIQERDEWRFFRAAASAVAGAVHRHGRTCRVLCAIEEPWHGTNRRTSLDLARRAGLWTGALYVAGADHVERLMPSAWRSVLELPCRPRATAKEAAQRHARLQCGWETDSTDEADACCIADALRRRRGEI